MKRIEDHGVLGPQPGEPIRVWINGQAAQARSTDSVAVALGVNGHHVLRFSRTGQPRGVYCGIGHCFECRVTVDSEPGVRACLRRVEHDMHIDTESAAR